MHSSEIVTRTICRNDKPKLKVLLRTYLEEETISNYMNLTEEDKNIFVQTYADVNITHSEV